jgi:hypothetical protein
MDFFAKPGLLLVMPNGGTFIEPWSGILASMFNSVT